MLDLWVVQHNGHFFGIKTQSTAEVHDTLILLLRFEQAAVDIHGDSGTNTVAHTVHFQLRRAGNDID